MLLSLTILYLFLGIYIVFIISVLVINTYPILACVQAPVPILGYALGIMYTDIL